MDADVIVQWVKTGWTKQSRGEPGATRRNAAPVGFVLPHLIPAVHEVRMSERYDFEPVWSKERSEIDRIALTLREDDEVLTVQLQDTVQGAPRRWSRHSPVRLARGEWVRWQIDHRWSGRSYGEWNYLLTTLNLAYGSPGDAEVFLGTPTQYVDERARLR